MKRMDNPVSVFISASEEDIQHERKKARELRSTQWWKQKRSNGVCHHCGGKFPARELTMDHLVPIARGGKSTKGNVVPSCKRCNTEKKVHLPFDWKST